MDNSIIEFFKDFHIDILLTIIAIILMGILQSLREQTSWMKDDNEIENIKEQN